MTHVGLLKSSIVPGYACLLILQIQDSNINHHDNHSLQFQPSLGKAIQACHFAHHLKFLAIKPPVKPLKSQIN